MTYSKEPIIIDYSKEALEMYLSKLSVRDIDVITYNIAKLLNGELNKLEIEWNRVDEKTNEPYIVKVPAKSFLRTDTIKKSLASIGVSETKILQYFASNP